MRNTLTIDWMTPSDRDLLLDAVRVAKDRARQGRDLRLVERLDVIGICLALAEFSDESAGEGDPREWLTTIPPAAAKGR